MQLALPEILWNSKLAAYTGEEFSKAESRKVCGVVCDGIASAHYYRNT
jgi:hypothetical protein